MTTDPLERLRARDPLGGALPPGLPFRPPPETRRAPRALTVANGVLLAAVAVHGIDHAFVQERGIAALGLHVVLGGASMSVATLASLAAAVRRDRRARAFALAAGPWVALAAFFGHFLPRWSDSFADPYSGLGLGAFSWGAAVAVVVAGLAVTVIAALTPAPRRFGAARHRQP